MNPLSLLTAPPRSLLLYIEPTVSVEDTQSFPFCNCSSSVKITKREIILRNYVVSTGAKALNLELWMSLEQLLQVSLLVCAVA
ncbi:hypothetical protein ACHQM5_017604 [Ranunculus cassubicifolius]